MAQVLKRSSPPLSSASSRTPPPQRACPLHASTLASALVVSKVKLLSLHSGLELNLGARVGHIRRVKALDTCGRRQGDIRVQEEAPVHEASSCLVFYTRTAVPEHAQIMLNRALFTRLARSSTHMCSAVESRIAPLTTVRCAGRPHVRAPREHLTRAPLQRVRLRGALSVPRCAGRKETARITPMHSNRVQLNDRSGLARPATTGFLVVSSSRPPPVAPASHASVTLSGDTSKTALTIS